ncbi:hypothetical protein Aperf_G00000075475 [Anoplocephala perfoliata]
MGQTNSEIAAIINEESTKIDLLIEKYSRDGKSIDLPRQPKKYSTIKAYPQSASIKVVKMISKMNKSSSDSTESNVEHLKMMSYVGRESSKENISIPHHSILDHDLLDDREACIGSLLNKCHWSSELPKEKDTAEVFTEFYEAWKHAEGNPLALTEKYSRLTNEYLTVLPRPDRRSMLSFKQCNDPGLFDAIDLECTAWQLIHALYSDRICHANSPLCAPSLKPCCHSEKEIINHLYDTDKELRETQIIVDWLEGKVRKEIVKFAEKFECLFNETTIWENTQYLMETMDIKDLKAKNVVAQFFPDAPFVGEGSLALKDIQNENRYLHYLFLCVRGGDLERAQRLCLQRGDITRAVAMEGWRPFHSSFLSEDISQPDNHVVEGNANRVLSKSVAWWNSENPALSIHERAIFAAQSGNLSALLKAITSGSWEDLLWAHCRALVESRVDATLRSKLDCGPRADTLAVFGRPQKGYTMEDLGLQVPNSAWTPSTWTLCDAFTKAETVMGWRPLEYLIKLAEDKSAFPPPPLKPTEIAAFLNRTVYDSPNASGDSRLPSSRHSLLQAMFYAIFRGVALREYTEVLTAVASVAPLFIPPLVREILSMGVSNAKFPDQLSLDQLDCQVLRFLAHLTLCLQGLEKNLPEEPCNTILEAYIITLIVERRFTLVASYISKLSTSTRQTRWYASFLSSLKKPDDRHRCLDYAEDAGLDVKRITRAVIRIVRRRFDEEENAGKDVPANAIAGPFLKPSQAKVTDIVGGEMVPYLTHLDKVRIAALDWLAHDRAQRGELLVLANSLMRLFIAMKKLSAARAVLDRLPMALLDQLKVKLLQAEEAYGTEIAKAAVPPWLANSIREHDCLVLYLQAKEAFDQWYIHRSSRPAPPPTVNTDAFSSLTERVAAEEAVKNYHARLECWSHEVELSTTALVKQLESLLTYESPGWLVDAAVFNINTTESNVAYDVTGMFNTSTMLAVGSTPNGQTSDDGGGGFEDDECEEGEEPGIAGLGDSPHSRKLQMNILRETCLREIVFTLVKVLKLTNRHAECVRLADLVADPRYGIFKLFSECQMQDFMDQLQESMLHLQKDCGDALGYIEN